MVTIGSFFAGILTWFLGLLGAAQTQKQADQIAKDADEIQSLKDMGRIKDTNAALSDSDILSKLRDQSAARRPPPVA